MSRSLKRWWRAWSPARVTSGTGLGQVTGWASHAVGSLLPNHVSKLPGDNRCLSFDFPCWESMMTARELAEHASRARVLAREMRDRPEGEFLIQVAYEFEALAMQRTAEWQAVSAQAPETVANRGASQPRR